MQRKVAELPEYFAKRQEGTITARLGDFTITDDATLLTVTNGSERQFTLDQRANAALAKYLKVPATYLDKLTPDFRATLLRYEFDRHKDASTVVESLGEDIIAVHQPSQTMLPLTRMAEVVTQVLDPEDTVRRLIINEERFHLDATTEGHAISFPANPQDPGYHEETAAIGDITEAGFRLLGYPFQAKRPSVSVYAERLICMNGQTTPEQLGRIEIKGRTVDEVCASLEEAAQLVLGQLDEYLERLGETRTMTVPGSPQAFAARLAEEAGLSRAALTAVIDIINQLEEPVTVWEVNQAFTSVANQSTRYATMMRMQNVGGALAFNAPHMIHRCTTCERIL
jgi:hypothetical protein